MVRHHTNIWSDTFPTTSDASVIISFHLFIFSSFVLCCLLFVFMYFIMYFMMYFIFESIIVVDFSYIPDWRQPNEFEASVDDGAML